MTDLAPPRSVARAAAFALPLMVLGLGTLLTHDARADEGMWPFNMVPTQTIKSRHGVEITEPWLDRLRAASIRFSSGGSGSFVSKDGLALTNHHVASDCIDKLSTPEKNYVENGFVAKDRPAELKCPDLELNVLESIRDVTNEVLSARTAKMSEEAANRAIKAKMSELEKACSTDASHQCEVVTLYAGGRYDLYRYKKIVDVRLAFAPEKAIAFFGGDEANFTYPRYDLDMTLVRAYEGGKPYAPKAHLAWRSSGPKDGEIVFVSGHPARTGRLSTVAELEVLRDVVYPQVLGHFKDLQRALKAYQKRGSEPRRQADKSLFRTENGIKALSGFLRGLKDPARMKIQRDEESKTKAAIMADPGLKKDYASVYAAVGEAQGTLRKGFERYYLLEAGPRSQLFSIARDLVRVPVEHKKADGDRLREYRDAAWQTKRREILSPAAIYPGVEEVELRVWLESLVVRLGKDDKLVSAILAGNSPKQVANVLATRSRLYDVGARRRVLDARSGLPGVGDDPMLDLVHVIDAEARRARTNHDDHVEAPMRSLGEKLAQLRFRLKGREVPPDATSSLRLSVGKVAGYTENGRKIAWHTTIGGAYGKATGKDPYRLPTSWTKNAASLKSSKTTFNFVSTNDIIGGNSGSPVVAADGSLVGLIFDGNLSSLPNRFVYREVTERAVSVSTAGMLEALKRIYGANALARELESGAR